MLAAPLWMLAQENYCGTVQTDSDLAWLREWQASYNGSVPEVPILFTYH